MSVRSLIYLSQGNIPTRWAHSFQAMRMAGAFARQVEDFELVTQVHWLRRWLPEPDWSEWYGLREPFRVVRLVTPGAPRRAWFRHDQYPAFDRRAAAYVEGRRPDLVFTRSPNAGAETTRRGVPTVIETHAAIDHPDIEGLLETAKRESFRGLVTITDALAEDYVRAGIDERAILVWPDAVDLESHRDLPPPAEARSALSLPADGPIALYAGHLYPHKGIGTVIEAAALLPEVHFVLVGGWDRDLRRARELSEGLRNVHLLGFVAGARVPLHLAAADVLLLPNSGEHEQARVTSPLKLFEYMAAGRPIVASAIPALEGWMVEGRNAALFRPDDAADLARAVRSVLDDPALGARLAQQSLREAASYTWDARARDILARFGGSGDGVTTEAERAAPGCRRGAPGGAEARRAERSRSVSPSPGRA